MENLSLAEVEEKLIALYREDLQERARKEILAFTVYTKPDYEINWHHAVLCKYLDRFARGEIKRLLVSMPPRHGKSELVSRRLPAFIFGQNPDAQIIATSYGADLASRMNRDVQRIIDEPNYRDLFPGVALSGDGTKPSASGSYLRNSDTFEIVGRRGLYRSAGVGGAVTGMGAHFALIDDPIKNQAEADSKTYRESVWEWYTSTLLTRLEKQGSVLLTLTRWHEDDLAGRLLTLAKADEGADQWTLLDLPAIKDTELNELDTRGLGEALWPGKYDLERLSQIKASVGSRVWSALYQQRPTAQEGGLILRDWIKFYKRSEIAEMRFDETIDSWDLTFKDSQTSDFVAAQRWSRFGANVYLRKRLKKRLDFPATLKAFRSWDDDPKVRARLVEDKANGPAVISTLKAEISCIVPVIPEGNKEERGAAIAPMWEAGNVYLPHPDEEPWVREFIEEILSFPNAAHDDEFDSMSQALWRLKISSGARLQKLVTL